MPVAVSLFWGTLAAPQVAGLVECENPASPVATWRALEAVVVLVSLAIVTLVLRAVPATEGNVTSQYEVANEVGERDEEQPPDPPLPVRLPLAQLDDGQVEREREGEEEDQRGPAGQEHEDHSTVHGGA